MCMRSGFPNSVLGNREVDSNVGPWIDFLFPFPAPTGHVADPDLRLVLAVRASRELWLLRTISIHCSECYVGCKLSGACNQVEYPPTGGSRGPSSQNGCGAAGNFTDGFTLPEMFLAAAIATAPGIGGGHSLANSAFDCFRTHSAVCGIWHHVPKERGYLGEPCLPPATVFRSGIPFHDRSDTLLRGFAANLIPIVFLTSVCCIW